MKDKLCLCYIKPFFCIVWKRYFAQTKPWFRLLWDHLYTIILFAFPYQHIQMQGKHRKKCVLRWSKMADKFRLVVVEEAEEADITWRLASKLMTWSTTTYYIATTTFLPTGRVLSKVMTWSTTSAGAMARFCNNYLGGSWGWEVLMAEPSTFHHLPEYWAGAQSAVQ